MTASVLSATGLRKEFDGTVALDGVDIAVSEGEIFGLLGPNGAGKSTMLNVFLGLVSPTSGSVTVLGIDVTEDSGEIRRRTGLLPDDFGLYDSLTGREHVELAIRSLDAGDDPHAILERVGLADAAETRAGEYSKGMRQRLALGMTLVDDPELLILDEPSSGLDPNGIEMMREIVREEADRGATVVFSSHNLAQVEMVCTRVGILRNGTFVVVDTIDSLREDVDRPPTVTVSTADVPDGLPETIESISGVVGVDVAETSIEVRMEDASVRQNVLSTVQQSDVQIEEFKVPDLDLEDIFSTYTTEAEA